MGKERMLARKIEDFGEHIGGARKHKTALAWVEALAHDDDPRAQTGGLAALWPTPRYESMLKEGNDAWLIAFAHALRDHAGAAPRRTGQYQRWRTKTLALRELAIQAVRSEIDTNDPQWLERDAKISLMKADLSTRSMLYHGHGHKIAIAKLAFTCHRAEKEHEERWTASIAHAGWRRIVAETETQAELIDAVLARKGVAKPEKRGTNPWNRTSEHYTVRAWRGETKCWVSRRGTGCHARLIECNSSTDAHHIISNEPQRCEEAWKRWKDIPPMRPATCRERIGPTPNLGIISPEQFSEAFSLRGVQFGNWVSYARREEDLIKAYLALHDLAEAIGWPLHELSLEGHLGLAFGARGNGGRSAGSAHYEPQREVINLTRNYGAGSLAHEWWHALDNAIARCAGRHGFATESRGWPIDSDLCAARRLADSIASSALPKRSAKLDQRKKKPYWSTMREMTARSFERYVTEQSAKRGVENDYLVRFTSFEDWTERSKRSLELDETYPYPTIEECARFEKGYTDVCAQARAILKKRPPKRGETPRES